MLFSDAQVVLIVTSNFADIDGTLLRIVGLRLLFPSNFRAFVFLGLVKIINNWSLSRRWFLLFSCVSIVDRPTIQCSVLKGPLGPS